MHFIIIKREARVGVTAAQKASASLGGIIANSSRRRTSIAKPRIASGEVADVKIREPFANVKNVLLNSRTPPLIQFPSFGKPDEHA